MPRVKKVALTKAKKRGRKKIVKPHAKAHALHRTLVKGLMDLKKYWSKQAVSLKKQQTALTAKLKKALLKQKKIKTAKANELVERFQTGLEEVHQWIEQAKENVSKYSTLESTMAQLEQKKTEAKVTKASAKSKGTAKTKAKAKTKVKAKAVTGKKRGRKPKGQEIRVASEDFDGEQAEEDNIFGLDDAEERDDFEVEGLDMDEPMEMEEEIEDEDEDEEVRF